MSFSYKNSDFRIPITSESNVFTRVLLVKLLEHISFRLENNSEKSAGITEPDFIENIEG